MILVFLFWFCALTMFHSYVVFPLLLNVFSKGKKPNSVIFSSTDSDLPNVFLLMAVYNEEKVIKQKLESVFSTSYPLHKLHVYIGSDNSTDKTNSIVQQFTSVKFFNYEGRNGKPNVLNKLMLEVESITNKSTDVLLFTDANVFFDVNTIYEMVKHFKNESISLVGANILNKGLRKDGISFQETSYIQRENSIKYLEGLNWGTMMGAFGGGYALRADCWKPIPEKFIVDDFYLSMNVIAKNKCAILELNSVCYEDVSNEIENEFNRKTRMQAGNFQNLSVYWKQLFRFNAVSFCFLSHKVIRWCGPFFLLLAFVSNFFLTQLNVFYQCTFLLQCFLFLSPIIDSVFKKINLHLSLLRFASYFIIMNLALAKGFFVFVKGVETNAWNRTERNI
ncbi:MAG: glycosyltransferase [Bacteroidetes bacterium]|nr:glycosyltransferase [Bacteroidota bacterium]